MINLLVNKALQVCKNNESIPRYQKKLWQSVYYNSQKLLYSLLIELTLKLKFSFGKKTIKPLDEESFGPIVSLTTFPARINSLWIVLHSIFTQTVRPSKVILVLTLEEFPDRITPKNLEVFKHNGLEIVFSEINLKPHNKYFYALQKYTNRGVITLDDDLYYWPDTIERLVNLSNKYPNYVCANTIAHIYWEDNKLTLKRNYDCEVVDIKNMALGVSGVYYPSSFRSRELFNVVKICELSLKADDLWLKAQALLMNIDIISSDRYITPLFVLGSQKIALRYENVDENFNEKQWQDLVKYYNLNNI